MTAQPQWMTEELLEQWRSDARRDGLVLHGSPPTHYTQAERILALADALNREAERERA
jgi:transposase-like protein